MIVGNQPQFTHPQQELCEEVAHSGKTLMTEMEVRH